MDILQNAIEQRIVIMRADLRLFSMAAYAEMQERMRKRDVIKNPATLLALGYGL